MVESTVRLGTRSSTGDVAVTGRSASCGHGDRSLSGQFQVFTHLDTKLASSVVCEGRCSFNSIIWIAALILHAVTGLKTTVAELDTSDKERDGLPAKRTQPASIGRRVPECVSSAAVQPKPTGRASQMQAECADAL